MTVVAALVRDGAVTMAADTLTNYVGTGVFGARKIRRIKVGGDEALIAVSGNGALLSLINQWTCDATPNPADDADVEQWATTCATALTELAAEAVPPITTTSSDGTQSIDGAFLLGWQGRLIYLFTRQAVVLPDAVAALGIGTDYALGYLESALNSHHRDGDTAEQLCSAAVRGACQRFDGCRVGPDGPVVETLAATTAWKGAA